MAQGKYANINGLKLYYEVHGKGKPLVLLHGGLGGVGMFTPLLPALAENRQVIGVDLEGHGHTADADRPFSFEQMGDDIAALVKQLGFEKADLAGYSLGGGVALQAAIRHPDVVRKLVLVSTPFKSDGWFPENRAGMQSMNEQAAQAMVGSPMHEAYVNSAPDPKAWPRLVAKTGRLVGQEYDWSAGVAAIRAPTMIVVGDADAIRPAHTVEFFGLLGGGKKDAGWDGSGMSNARLAVLPGTTHYNIFFSPLLAPVITTFLDAPMPGAK
ncbi:MAG: alpha/beta fold hydrolase [Acidobacteriota bacterium]